MCAPLQNNSNSIKPVHPLRVKRIQKPKPEKYRVFCLKCNSFHHMTRHHVIPKVHLNHFSINPKGAPTVSLCQTCHRDLERQILWTEAFVHRGRIGERLPLKGPDDYWYILSMFIGIQRFSELFKSGKIPRHPTSHIKHHDHD